MTALVVIANNGVYSLLLVYTRYSLNLFFSKMIPEHLNLSKVSLGKNSNCYGTKKLLSNQKVTEVLHF